VVPNIGTRPCKERYEVLYITANAVPNYERKFLCFLSEQQLQVFNNQLIYVG
jgi:hypothetical protein